MFSLQSLLIDAIWVLGVSGWIAAVSYIGWYRRSNNWTWGHALSVPRLRFPLYLSLTTLSGGLALSEVTAHQRHWWAILAWGFLFSFFFITAILQGVAEVQNGWDTSTEEGTQ